jgi:hypothetical protein
MREADYIAMPGVPLITARCAEAAADAENDRVGTQCDNARATEEAARPGVKNVRDDGAEGHLGETERAEATVNDVVAALTPTEPAAASEGGAVPAPDGNVPAAACAEENPADDASETVHAAEVEPTLLASSSPGREPPGARSRRVN